MMVSCFFIIKPLLMQSGVINGHLKIQANDAFPLITSDPCVVYIRVGVYNSYNMLLLVF
jgi:hypothetical protein